MPPGHKRVSSGGLAGAFVKQDHGTALVDNRGADLVHRQRMILATETYDSLARKYGIRRAARPVHPNSTLGRSA